jgi:transcriptional regulator GlxA family with amidase domain
MERNCGERLLINEIASKCGYSVEHFSRIFKKYTGKSPMAYISECRIMRAKDMLLNTEKPIEVIISECGFSNRTAFFKKFFCIEGVTPLQFRKNRK